MIRSFFVAFVATQLVSCRAPMADVDKRGLSDSSIVHGLTDYDLNYIGRRLGYKVEARGMSDYAFTGHGLTFFVDTHLAFTPDKSGPAMAMNPITLSRGPRPWDKKPYIVEFPVSQGVTLKCIEDQISSYAREAKLPPHLRPAKVPGSGTGAPPVPTSTLHQLPLAFPGGIVTTICVD